METRAAFIAWPILSVPGELRRRRIGVVLHRQRQLRAGDVDRGPGGPKESKGQKAEDPKQRHLPTSNFQTARWLGSWELEFGRCHVSAVKSRTSSRTA